MKKLVVVVPCYNEEAVLNETIFRLNKKYEDLFSKNIISKESLILYVDDGSKDSTWSIITMAHQNNPTNIGLKLSRNFGHQNALIAGLLKAKNLGDCIISMDADLQDDINALDAFLEKYDQGFEIVYGVRNKRIKDSVFKRNSAELFYHLMKLLGVDLVFNHADYRLMSQRALNLLEQYEEVNLFIRGIVPTIGLKSTTVFYDREKRFAGESKYPLFKMLSFAFEGVTSFSIKPIRMIFSVGVSMMVVSILIILYTLVRYFDGQTVTGWAFLNISLWFVAGVQTFLLGVVGEYVGKSYSEIKKRPRYLIETELI